MVVAHYWQSNLRKFKAKPGLHSSGTARESYILRPCLKKQKPKRKKRREESLWTRFPFAFKITWFLWMLTHGCSFVVIILFDFYTEVTLLELSMFVYLILPISLVYTKLLFVNTTMHCTSQNLSSGTRVGKERHLEGVSRLAGHRYTCCCYFCCKPGHVTPFQHFIPARGALFLVSLVETREVPVGYTNI